MSSTISEKCKLKIQLLHEETNKTNIIRRICIFFLYVQVEF
jgi:hypothetical protein